MNYLNLLGWSKILVCQPLVETKAGQWNIQYFAFGSLPMVTSGYSRDLVPICEVVAAIGYALSDFEYEVPLIQAAAILWSSLSFTLFIYLIELWVLLSIAMWSCAVWRFEYNCGTKPSDSSQQFCVWTLWLLMAGTLLELQLRMLEIVFYLHGANCKNSILFIGHTIKLRQNGRQ